LEHFKSVKFIDTNSFRGKYKTGIARNRVDMASKKLKQSLNSMSNEFPKINRSSKNSVQTNVKQNSNDNNVNKNTFEEIFIELEKELPEYVIAQEGFLKGLSIAFKRPILHQKNEGIKNVVFITGPRGTGRHLSVKVATNFLSKKKLLISKEVKIIDLSKYKLEKNVEALFVPDVFRAFYSRSQVIVFDNLSECHPMVIDYITKIVVDEKLKMDKRYKEQNNGMSDITGVLEVDATDEILVNNKYIFFITEKKESFIKNTFPTKFLNKVNDILSTEELNVNALEIITSYHIEETLEKSNKNLNIVLTVEDNVVQNIVHNLEVNKGAFGIFEYIEKNIYNSLVELVIHKEISSNNAYKISVRDNNLLLTCDGYEKVINNMFKDNTEEILLELDTELDNVIGLKNIKDFIIGLKDNIRIQRQREINGENKSNISLHMVFTGNPGTGKTTIARIVAKYLKTLGYLSSGHLIEITRNDLVGMYVGETTQKTFSKINAAKGGILFIDEAYSLVKNKNDIFGLEAVDTLVKYMEDYRDDLVVIMAGYKDEMEGFLETNSGLLSRFNNQIEFEDYSNEELLNILKVTVKVKGYNISEADDKEFLELFERKRIKGKNDSGNGRLVRNLVEKAIVNSTKRLSNVDIANLNPQNLSELTLLDFQIQNKKEIDLEKRLDDIVGLESVKAFVKGLQKQLIANKKRKKMGITLNNSQSLNMIFTGNPGTGKTTVARVIAQLMSDMGILKTGQVIETDRSGLIGQYLGETTKKTTEIFKKAMGGVLFIDEAYALVSDSNNNDIYGKEAIDTLVKLVEEHREDTVVILAGYSKEMSEFLNSNSGLKSRFPLKINFPDYNLEELYSIGMILINEKGFKLEKTAEDDFLNYISLKKRTAGSNQGNGRMVRNIVEELIRNQSGRIADSEVITEGDIQIIKKEDFIIEETSNEKEIDLKKRLDDIVGLESVKAFVKGLQKQLIANKKRKKMGITLNNSQSLNMIFTGNPGTGKTTVARVIAQLMSDMGILKTGQVIETDRSGLVGQYLGETTKKTTEVFREARGGVLFIDEAYALVSSSDDNDRFGKEAIDTLVKLVEEYREDTVVILAGYSKEMSEFLNTNSGLKSRFPLQINFPDYNLEELYSIGMILINEKGFKLEKTAEDDFLNFISLKKRTSGSNQGNGRMVRNIVEELIRNQSGRIADSDVILEGDIQVIKKEDIIIQDIISEKFDLESRLENVIGLQEVKNYIRSLQAQTKIRNERKKIGLLVDTSQSLHMIFKGNPGTGKTTMARIVADVLYNLGILRSRKLVETDRSGLVAGYVGQTALKTKSKIDEALGGVLFIDEAYALASRGTENDFGKEAIDTLVKAMDDNRDDLLIILAGYNNDMDDFLNMNPGLQSRFPNIIEFEDYTIEELITICSNMYTHNGYIVTEEGRGKLESIFETALINSNFGNGRYCRNVMEKSIRNQALRLAKLDDLNRDKLITIIAEDIEEI